MRHSFFLNIDADDISRMNRAEAEEIMSHVSKRRRAHEQTSYIAVIARAARRAKRRSKPTETDPA